MRQFIGGFVSDFRQLSRHERYPLSSVLGIFANSRVAFAPEIVWKRFMRSTHNPLSLLTKIAALTVALVSLGSPSAHAGQPVADKEIKETVSPVEPPYEAGRGLLTLQGPSGMFINPTSATLPKGAFTLQYCNFYPNNRTEIVAHGWMAAYGITDWLEIGANANVLNVPVDRELGVGGPLIRVRLLRDQEWWPQISVGAYGKYGTNALQQSTVFLAAYKRLPLDEDGFFKSLGFHAGIRQTWFHDDFAEDDSLNIYGGAELQLPYRLYLVGEVGTKGNTPAGRDPRTPYAFGAQWRLGMVNISFAGIQNGTTEKTSLYYGVGTAIPF